MRHVPRVRHGIFLLNMDALALPTYRKHENKSASQGNVKNTKIECVCYSKAVSRGSDPDGKVCCFFETVLRPRVRQCHLVALGVIALDFIYYCKRDMS